MRTWKMGSRWGDNGPSVLDLFIDYGCVFIGGVSGFERIGHYWEVSPDDLIIISDGAIPVAIAKALSKFQPYLESGLKFAQSDYDEYIDVNVRLCKAKIALLTENERNIDWGISPRHPFCAHSRAQMVQDYWASHEQSLQRGAFDIKSDTWHLIENADHAGVFSQNKRYRVPIYQRPYSWGENELRRFVEDLNQAVKNKEPVFIGTMQLSQAIPLKPDGSRNAYDLIDGQQRTTTFIILLLLLLQVKYLQFVLLSPCHALLRIFVY